MGYEAVALGMPGYRPVAGQLNGLAGLPVADKTLVRSWPPSANAALAAVNRSFFANTSAANLRAIDSLETATRAACRAGPGADVSRRSVDFSERAAAAVFAWPRADGYDAGGGGGPGGKCKAAGKPSDPATVFGSCRPGWRRAKPFFVRLA